MSEEELQSEASKLQFKTGYRFLECLFMIAFEIQDQLDQDLYAQIQLEFEDYLNKMEAAGMKTFVDLRPNKNV